MSNSEFTSSDPESQEYHPDSSECFENTNQVASTSTNQEQIVLQVNDRGEQNQNSEKSKQLSDATKPYEVASGSQTETVKIENMCDICGKVLTRVNNLKSHKRIHTGEKPHQCIYCGRRFIKSCNKQDHIRNVHKQMPYQCFICGKRFDYKSSLTIHLEEHKTTANNTVDDDS